MSTVKSKKLQVGTDASASNNFTIYQPATPDGTLRIGIGNADSPTEVGRFTSAGYKPATAPAFAAYLSANQSISSSTWTKAALNTELYDTTNSFDSSSTYRFTPQVEGYYQVNVNMSWVGSSISRFIVKISKNGSDYCQVRDGTGNTYFTSGSQLVYMNGSTDYLEFYAYIVGTSPGIEGGSTYRTLVSASLIQQA